MSLLATLDWSVIAVYFMLVFGVAIWASLRERANKGTSADYFLAGRDAGWFLVGGSLFASNIGSEHLVGLAGTGAASGVAVGQFEILASLILLLLGWVFVPFYLSSGVFTMPEFLERRYSEGARWYLAIISIIGYVLTKISVTIAAGGIVFEALMGIDFWTGALIVVVITGIYTIFGGLRAVLYTDLLQMFVLVGGAVATSPCSAFPRSEDGGRLQGTVGPAFLDLWKPATDPDFPWTGILFGAPILGVWYWCTDQFIVQRVLAARDQDNARRGTVFAGYLKLLPLFIFVIPGVIAYALSQRGALQLDTPDQALPTLIGVLLPVGLRGLVVAGLLAAFDELSLVRIQLHVDPGDVGRLQEAQARSIGTPAGPGRTAHHGGARGFRAGVDPAHEAHLGAALPIPPERAGVHRAADRRRLPHRNNVETGERQGRHGGAAERVRTRYGQAGGRARQVEARWAALHVRGHQLPALRGGALRHLHHDPRRGEPAHGSAAR